MNSIKLRVRLRVATIKKASCARLRVRRGFGLRSCGCGNSKQVASHALTTYVRQLCDMRLPRFSSRFTASSATMSVAFYFDSESIIF